MTAQASALPSSWRSIGRSLRMGHRAEPRLLVVAFVTTVAAALPDALFALGIAKLAEAVVAAEPEAILLSACAVGALATGTWLLNVLSERVNQRLADRASVPMEAHAARMMSSATTIEHHERPDFADLLALLRDAVAALSGLYQSLFSTVGAFVRLLLTLGLLMSVDPVLGLLGLCAVPIVLATNWRGGVEKSVEEAGAQHDRLARHLFLLGTTPEPAKEVRIAGVRRRLRDDRRAAWLRRYRPLARTRWASAAWQAGAVAVFGLAFVAAVWWAASDGGSSVGPTLVVLVAGSRLSAYVGQTVGEIHLFRTIWLDVSRRLTWLEDFAEASAGPADVPAPVTMRRGIAFENVSFRYPGTNRLVLDGVSVDLPAGAVIALVGENGAGKSSLVKLLCRFYAPSYGRIAVDGADLARIAAPAWRERLSGAFQDFCRFEFRVREAVGVGDLARFEDRSTSERAVEQTIQRAIHQAGAVDVVADLDDGLDTQLGATWPGGVELSHGQWQKLALARGFMRTAPLVLVLDEPTSALDAETEHALFEGFATAARARKDGRITLLVSHRFSTVRMADLIIVLDGGRVVEQGTHDELMRRRGTYADLYTLQASAYER
ncbi:ABC transporter ATP-binding protein [Actinopolymorpha sp. B17G11]|uniref:ABC transporter ATP-binding protein n=1 Tax=Actinopolymorpha sp. B17G11 TaxID=3160861 RepID=UPI0032E51B39